jgi:tetratricopeptide (TPR) repeat protein
MVNNDIDSRHQQMLITYQQGSLQEAIAIGRQLVHDLEHGYDKKTAQEHETAQLAQCYYSLALVFQSSQELAQAAQYAERSLELLRQCYGQNSLEVAHNLNFIGVINLMQERFSQAEAFFTQALEIISSSKGQESQEYAEFLSNLAQVYKHQGRFERAQDAFSRALQPKRDIYGDDHPSVALTMSGLASTYKALGNRESAKWVYSLALAIMEKTLPSNHPDLLRAQEEFAELKQTDL